MLSEEEAKEIIEIINNHVRDIGLEWMLEDRPSHDRWYKMIKNEKVRLYMQANYGIHIGIIYDLKEKNFEYSIHYNYLREDNAAVWRYVIGAKEVKRKEFVFDDMHAAKKYMMYTFLKTGEYRMRELSEKEDEDLRKAIRTIGFAVEPNEEFSKELNNFAENLKKYGVTPEEFIHSYKIQNDTFKSSIESLRRKLYAPKELWGLQMIKPEGIERDVERELERRRSYYNN